MIKMGKDDKFQFIYLKNTPLHIHYQLVVMGKEFFYYVQMQSYCSRKPERWRWQDHYTANVAIGLARNGNEVVIVDFDPQGDLTACLGWKNNDALENTVSTMLDDYINDKDIRYSSLIMKHEEDVDVIPANIELADFEMRLVSVINREQVLSSCLEPLRERYDYILIDCPPSLGMLTVNALSAADQVLIPVQAQYLPAKGMTKLLQTISKVQRNRRR